MISATILLAIVGGVYVFSVFRTQEVKILDDDARKKIGGSFVQLSEGKVYYQLQGSDTARTVVLIHGAGSGSYAWDKNFDYLVKQGFRVLRYDLYGRGFSDRPDVVYDSTLFYQQLAEIIDKLQVKPPYNFVSVSMGASIALHFVQKNKSLVSHLVLVDPASLSDGNLPWHKKVPFLSAWLMSLYWYPRAVEKQMSEFYNPASVPEYRPKSWEHLQYQGLKRAMLSTWQHLLTLDMTIAMNEIGKSKVKVLLVWGKYDPLVPPKASEHYLKAMPQSNLLVIDSAGHLSNYEKPIVFNPLVSNFLKNDQ